MPDHDPPHIFIAQIEEKAEIVRLWCIFINIYSCIEYKGVGARVVLQVTMPLHTFYGID